MIVDLHAHYAMHLKQSGRTAPPRRHETPGDLIRETVLRLANRLANFPDDRHPAVTIENLRAGQVLVALSVLYLPFTELDFTKRYGAPPAADYFEDLLALIDAVEDSLAARPQQDAAVAHNLADVERELAAGKVVLIHAIEGGFHVGEDRDAIRTNVRRLRQRGVAYITPAHLFFRGLATNAPALPFMKDEHYHRLFPQPRTGLTALGRDLIEAMAEEHILIDVTHMSKQALAETLSFLDQIDPHKTIPVLASHGACQHGDAEYNLDDAELRAVAERNGVVGLIACKHWMADGLKEPETFEQSLDLFVKHIERIRKATQSDDVAAIGSDTDGFIKPALPGFESPPAFVAVENHLRDRYPADLATKICSNNALRILGYWDNSSGHSRPNLPST